MSKWKQVGANFKPLESKESESTLWHENVNAADITFGFLNVPRGFQVDQLIGKHIVENASIVFTTTTDTDGKDGNSISTQDDSNTSKWELTCNPLQQSLLLPSVSRSKRVLFKSGLPETLNVLTLSDEPTSTALSSEDLQVTPTFLAKPKGLKVRWKAYGCKRDKAKNEAAMELENNFTIDTNFTMDTSTTAEYSCLPLLKQEVLHSDNTMFSDGKDTMILIDSTAVQVKAEVDNDSGLGDENSMKKKKKKRKRKELDETKENGMEELKSNKAKVKIETNPEENTPEVDYPKKKVKKKKNKVNEEKAVQDNEDSSIKEQDSGVCVVERVQVKSEDLSLGGNLQTESGKKKKGKKKKKDGGEENNSSNVAGPAANEDTVVKSENAEESSLILDCLSSAVGNVESESKQKKKKKKNEPVHSDEHYNDVTNPVKDTGLNDNSVVNESHKKKKKKKKGLDASVNESSSVNCDVIQPIQNTQMDSVHNVNVKNVDDGEIDTPNGKNKRRRRKKKPVDTDSVISVKQEFDDYIENKNFPKTEGGGEKNNNPKTSGESNNIPKTGDDQELNKDNTKKKKKLKRKHSTIETDNKYSTNDIVPNEIVPDNNEHVVSKKKRKKDKSKKGSADKDTLEPLQNSNKDNVKGSCNISVKKEPASPTHVETPSNVVTLVL